MRNILIVAFDGLQPAQVTPALMPNLASFVAEGVAFDHHHPVYPSVTRINAASMVTGRNPGAHGIAANILVMRDYDPHTAFSALEPTLAKVALKTKVLLAPTLAEHLQPHGLEYVAISTGTSGNAYLHSPHAERVGGATIHPEFGLPNELQEYLVGRFGEWPPEGVTNGDKLVRAVDIMTEYVLAERKPAVSLVWFSEPDKSQHAHGVCTEVSTRALREADEQFGRLLSWIDAAGTDTDVIVISDHGYSTISEVIDVEGLLRSEGFPLGDQPGGVTVAGNGGSVLFYAHDRDAATVDTLAGFLMQQRWCGSLVASDAIGQIEGTLPASLVGIEGPRAPDLAMSFQWNSHVSPSGYAGYAFSAGGAPELGQHGSMSRHEMRNSLFARGGSFQSGIRVASPTGNTDLAPTVLHLLGLDGGETMHGRVLHEALAGGN
ncbi:MAG: alkaline phosphatase family protein, partial [Chloroflexi bacterium]|nr:alkaline phosphatase family protein [Chloroflexota bacterium]